MTSALLLAAVLSSPAPAQPAAVAPQPPVTLLQCVAWAKTVSEDLKSREQDIKAAQARARAALGGAFPQIEWDWDSVRNDPKGVNALAAQGFGGFVEKHQEESRFTARQALFHGLRELSAYQGFGHQEKRDALQLRRAGDDLFQRTADAFYAVLAAESDRDNLKDAIQASRDRIKELNGFRRLGKARASEVYTAEARAAALEATLRQDEALITATREDLSFLTDHDLSTGTLSDELAPTPPVPDLQASVDKAKVRSDLRAQREDLEGRQAQVRYERGNYFPALDLTGDYYTKRATFMQQIKWDLRFDVRVPLFQGGSVAANVDAAKAAARQSEFLLEEMERRVTHDVRKLHSDLVSAVEETQAQETAAAAAQKSYDTQREEYKLGLVTNLDVLAALDLLESQRSARDAARLKAKRIYYDLASATETLP